MNNYKILLTGCAVFGSHLSIKLAKDHPDWVVHGVDNVNNYYDVQLKEDRLKNVSAFIKT